MLYAIGQLHVKLEQCDQAIPFYERFLSMNPDLAAAGDATEAIEVCKTRLARSAKLAPAPVIVLAPHREPSPWYGDKLGIGLVAGGTVLGLMGFLIYRSARAELDDAEAATSYTRHVELVEGARGKRTYAMVFGAGALALTGVGVARFVMQRRRTELHGVAVVPGRDGGLVTWTARF